MRRASSIMRMIAAVGWIGFSVFSLGILFFTLSQVWHVFPRSFFLTLAPLLAVTIIALVALAILGFYQFQGKNPFQKEK